MTKNISVFKRNFSSSSNSLQVIGTGSMGGKAHGLAIINEIIASEAITDKFPEFDVNIPSLYVIQTDIFDAFMSHNNLADIAYSNMDDKRIAHAFLNADLPFEILGDIRSITENFKRPLAVRSSSLLEDAMYEPFAGIYGTKMTPNNQHDVDTRFRKLVEAIKFVYASTFFKSAKEYMAATKHKVEDEKMAVLIQEVVGNRHSDRFYPEISGVARSFNFYPMGRAKPENGVVNLALGLGKTIVDGGVVWSYAPEFPKINPPFGSVSDMLKQTQTEFWSVNMGKPPAYDPVKETEYMIKGNLIDAEKDGVLKYVASTLDNRSGRVTIGIGVDGPRILTFAPLLILDEYPFNELIKKLLKICEEAYKAPVEIEFAISFPVSKNEEKKCRFGFLQVRPMVVSTEEITIDPEELISAEVFVATKNGLGNGIVNDLQDIVFVKPEIFESKHTQKIALEIETVNRKMLNQKIPYLLVGFGRWGSSDPWLGIPVNWGQISGVKAIIEATLENMNVDLSQGSHFFHNLTSFNVGYFSVPFSSDYKIDWKWLNNQSVIEETQYIKHVRLKTNMQVKIDGRSGRGIIYKINPDL